MNRQAVKKLEAGIEDRADYLKGRDQPQRGNIREGSSNTESAVRFSFSILTGAYLLRNHLHQPRAEPGFPVAWVSARAQPPQRQ